jgi:CheY-like chemotaxis protein/HPt (histidine-containing phosphotransfer) domain-containing protein
MRLVNDVLDHSKLEAGGLALENIPFAPARLLEEVLDLFIPEAREKGLSLRIVPGAGLPEECLGDPHRLGQVLTNLVGNAIKFTERGGVELRVEREEPRDDRVRLRFAVRDTGIGIPAGRLDQVFAPYAQADPSMARRYGGTGLGLAISKKLVEGMGGVLTAESSAAGSTFAFSLGFHPAPPRGADPGPPRGPEVPCLRGHRLLLVEDNPLNQQLASILLSESGAQVEVAQSGSEALARLQAEDFSAVLMDIHMPGMDGLETARRARAMGCSRPIIAMTAHTLDGHWEACREAGMDDFITKPIDPGLLFAALGRWVQEAPAPPSAGTRPGPPQGDPDALEALAGLLDLPTALGRIAGRADLLMGVIRSFLDEPIQPAAIEAALSRGDRAAACRMVHDLKGIAGILAMADLAEASAELEARLLEDSPDTWADPFARLGPILSRFLAAARRAIGDAPPAGGLPP